MSTPLIVVGIVVVREILPDVIVRVWKAPIGLTTSTTEVAVPDTVVATVVVNTGALPEVIVTVLGGMDGLTTSTKEVT